VKIELRKVSFSERNSEETNCFAADIYINGKRAGECSNDGHGGSTSYRIQPESLEREFEAYCKGLPPTPADGDFPELPMSADFYLDILVVKWLENKDLEKLDRQTKTHTIFRNNGKTFTIATPLNQKIVDQLCQQCPTCEVRWNGAWTNLGLLQQVPAKADPTVRWNKLSKTKTVIRIGETVKIVNRPLSLDVYSYLRSFHPTAEVWFNGNWRTQQAVQGVL
jgi:hypothetical protein